MPNGSGEIVEVDSGRADECAVVLRGVVVSQSNYRLQTDHIGRHSGSIEALHHLKFQKLNSLQIGSHCCVSLLNFE